MGLAAWVGSTAPGTVRARRALDALPRAAHGLEVPFPYENKAAYHHGHSNAEINEAIEGAPVEQVPLAGLHAIQHSVRRSKVLEYIDDSVRVPEGTRKQGPPHNLVDLPIIVRCGGVDYIHDGHHRATAALLSGQATIRARVVELGGASDAKG